LDDTEKDGYDLPVRTKQKGTMPEYPDLPDPARLPVLGKEAILRMKAPLENVDMEEESDQEEIYYT
jgi:hypothetical protein